MNDLVDEASLKDLQRDLGRVGDAIDALSRLLSDAHRPLPGPGVGAILGIIGDQYQEVRADVFLAFEGLTESGGGISHAVADVARHGAASVLAGFVADHGDGSIAAALDNIIRPDFVSGHARER
jgi:hypothetical protein